MPAPRKKAFKRKKARKLPKRQKTRPLKKRKHKKRRPPTPQKKKTHKKTRNKEIKKKNDCERTAKEKERFFEYNLLKKKKKKNPKEKNKKKVKSEEGIKEIRTSLTQTWCQVHWLRFRIQASLTSIFRVFTCTSQIVIVVTVKNTDLQMIIYNQQILISYIQKA